METDTAAGKQGVEVGVYGRGEGSAKKKTKTKRKEGEKERNELAERGGNSPEKVNSTMYPK